MTSDIKSGLLRYGISVLIFAGFVGAAALLAQYSIKINFAIPVIIGLVVVSWYGGRRPGLLLAILVSGSSIYRSSIQPESSLLQWAFGHFTAFAVLVFIVLLISGRRSVETHLRESEERYHILFDNNPFPMWVYDLETLQFLAVNDAASFFYGYSREEFLSMTIKDIRPADEVPALLEDVAATVDKVNTSSLWQHRKKDGSLIDAEITSHKLNFGGRSSRLVLAMDVTERKRAQESLAYSGAIVAASDDAIIGKTLEGMITSWNPGAEKIFGYTPAEAIGQSMLMLFPADRTDEEEALLSKIRQGESIEQFETVRVRKDGKLIDVSVTLSPISDVNGKIIGVSKIARDITASKLAQDEVRRLNEELEQRILDRTAKLNATNNELHKENVARQQAEDILRQSEKRTRLIIDTARDAFVAIDSEGEILTWNTQAEVTFGWPQDEMIGRRLSETIIPPQHRRAHRLGLQHFLSTGHGPVVNQRIEITALHRDGHEFPVELTIWPIKTGTIYTFNSFIRDITESKRSEGKIRKLNETLGHRADQLEAANRELEAFSYSVSHDLRAPLRHIDGFVRLLAKREAEKLDATSERYLNVVSGAVTKMGLLIDELLAFSRTGRQEINFTRVDLNALVQQSRKILSTDIGERDIRWNVNPLPAVKGDATLFGTAMTNLISNAIKYTRNQETAHIEIGVAAEGDGTATIFVRDNGAGFDMQYADKLFGVFQRLHREEEFEGIGIGLATVQKIVNRHGGQIRADGAVGEGATFYVTLKKAKGETHEH